MIGAKSKRPKATSATGSDYGKGCSDMELYNQAELTGCQIYRGRHKCCVEGLAISVEEPQSRPLGFWIRTILYHRELYTDQKEAPNHGVSSDYVIGTAHQELGVVRSTGSEVGRIQQ